ncbi:TMAO reductase system protein TorT [Paenibacillus beijingensis]|uniref:Periplasmic binding protein domain-containing protein n=1 Tax=Paenibacillus beijingensis TaxID=1126833 RepID=A0A0D5NJU2_9BACL|nr:TMAO reductase system protein TorT [Paenibacillus beijingensis]AJY75188.1 hypothetical protein VN24_12125 [Paenibacillus beijingensis]
MRKIYLSTMFTIMTILLLSACSSNANQPEVNQDDIVIGLSVPSLSSSFWTSIVYGAQSEADRLGAKLIVVNAGGDTKVQDQISQIQNLIQKQVDALIVGATDGKGVAPIVSQAVSKGIPVVGLSSLPESDELVSEVGADHYKIGQLLAKGMGDALKGTGQVAMMAGPAGQHWATDRAKGFQETISSEFPAIKIVSIEHTDDNRNGALTLMEDWLQRFPDLTGVFTATDDIGAGAADAIAAANKTGGILIASSNLSPVGIDYMKRGLITFETAEKVVVQGKAAAEQAYNAVAGKPVEKQVITDVLYVDRNGIDSVDLSEINAPDGFKP